MDWGPEMRVLVLGATGMLGHKLVQVIAPELETVAVVRRPGSLPRSLPAAEVVAVEASDLHALIRLLDRVKPHAVLNAIGVVKQAVQGTGEAETIALNSLLPRQLAGLCRDRAIRLVHYSTDCVFSGE